MAQVRHRKRFDGGRRTPQEYHAEHAFPPNAKCHACGVRPSIRAIVLAPFDEVQKRGMLPPGLVVSHHIMTAMVMIQEPSGPKPYIRLSCTYSCRQCRKELEKALAKGPSWCIHEINEGPDPTNRIVV